MDENRIAEIRIYNIKIRWITNLMIGLGTGFMVTGFATLALGDLSQVRTAWWGGGMVILSVFCVPASFLLALLEIE